MFLLKNIDITVADGAFFSIIAMLIVFAVLTILVICIAILSKFKFKENKKEEPVPVAVVQKKLSVEDIKDEDMMVAALVATVEFIEETKKTDARVVSIKQIG